MADIAVIAYQRPTRPGDFAPWFGADLGGALNWSFLLGSFHLVRARFGGRATQKRGLALTEFTSPRLCGHTMQLHVNLERMDATGPNTLADGNSSVFGLHSSFATARSICEFESIRLDAYL
ncbi:hypothetical protein AB7M49_004083 [Bradyrhizobium elkanii]